MGEKLEFYLYESELWCKDELGNNVLVDPSKEEVIDRLLTIIRECYPQAYKALQTEYEKSAPNKRYYRYLIAKRFAKCNFGTLDSACYDIDGKKVNFERVECPLRSECKLDGVVCSPIFNTSLSTQEKKVGRLWYDGLSKDEIAGMLYLSPETVNNHIRNIYYKLGVHEKADFVKYINDKNIKL